MDKQVTDLSLGVGAGRLRATTLLPLALAALVAVAIGVYVLPRLWQAASVHPDAPPPLTQQSLEAAYGVQINLLAVTAMGGIVDLRLKVVDADKAGRLLETAADYPVLLAADGARLATAEDPNRQRADVKLANDGMLFFIFPNEGNAVRTGAPVTLVFGDQTVEPIAAR